MSDPEAYWLDAELSDSCRPDDEPRSFPDIDSEDYWVNLISKPEQKSINTGYVPPRKRNRKLP